MTVVKLSWENVLDRVLWRILSNSGYSGTVYGVPRGGAVVAGLVRALAPEVRVASRVEDADFVVDDIVDSGRTRDTFKAKHPSKPFYSLVDKKCQQDAACGWVQFPWEHPAEQESEENVVRLLQAIGEDPARDGLRETPGRVVKALREMTSGSLLDPAVILAREFESEGYDEMVVCRDIEFVSLCEHHMLPFTGVAHVGYIPGKKIVGLSKMARLVDCFARRLQVQERLTKQVADAMEQNLNPLGVGVVVQASHSCMSCRGVRKAGSEMVTSALRGVFREGLVRAEFMALCRRGA